MFAAVTELINEQELNKERSDDEDDEEDIIEEENDYGDILIKITSKVRSLLRVLALKTEDSTAGVQGKNLALYEIIKPAIDEDSLKGVGLVGQYAYFVKYIYPALRGSLNSIFSSIPRTYKDFRKSLPEELKSYWSPEILQYIMETTKNRALCPQEQALLVGFINRICRAYKS